MHRSTRARARECLHLYSACTPNRRTLNSDRMQIRARTSRRRIEGEARTSVTETATRGGRNALDFASTRDAMLLLRMPPHNLSRNLRNAATERGLPPRATRRKDIGTNSCLKLDSIESRNAQLFFPFDVPFDLLLQMRCRHHAGIRSPTISLSLSLSRGKGDAR